MHINTYNFGSITIDGKQYSHDVIIFPDHVQPEWWREDGHLLQIKDMDGIFAAQPKKIIIGTGHSGCMKIDEKVKEKLAEEGIELISAYTTEATKLYNNLKNKELVIAGFHLTC